MLPREPLGVLDDLIAEAEVSRVLQICNACRYCEGYCAVFPAMARRLEFGPHEAHYLANLCHHCGACLHACQYAPPHEFAVNVPQAMARVRRRTYAHYAWPRPLGRLYERNGLVVALALAAALAAFLVLAVALNGSLRGTPSARSFYAVFPHGLMAGLFAPVFGWAVLALGVGVAHFWRDQDPGPPGPGAVDEAVHDVLHLKYLGGGHGLGCNEDSDRWTLARRRLHHLTFYGFGLCFAATSLGTVYHYVMGWPAPYGWTTWPKILGTLGGIGLLAGPAGLFWLRRRRHPQQGDPAQAPMDLGFIALLFATSLTGLVLAYGAAPVAVPVLLCLHLGTVMALFLTMPYGKFAHGVYRAAALLKWSIERRQPTALRLGGD